MSMAKCIYCGHEVVYGAHVGVKQTEAHRLLVEHDRVCPANPIVKEREALDAYARDLADSLHRLATYPGDCTAADRQYAQQLVGRYPLKKHGVDLAPYWPDEV